MTTRRRRRWGLGLRGRIALAVVLAVATGCAVLTLTTTRWAATNHLQRLVEQLHEAASSEAGELLRVLEANPDASTPTELIEAGWDLVVGPTLPILVPLENLTDEVDPARAEQLGFLNDWGSVIERNPECLRIRPKVMLSSPGAMGSWSEICGPWVLGFGVILPDTETGAGDPWLVARALYLPDQDDPVPALRDGLLLRSGVIVAGSALLALALAWTVARPVARAGRVATAVADGDLAARIPVRGNDALAVMSDAINAMADRLTGQIADLERANEAQRRFVSDVAHELRTPTAALLASAEALDNPATRGEAATLVGPQLRRLAGLTEDLLEISRMDAGHAAVALDRVDVVDLVAEVIADTDIGYHGPAELMVTTDPVRLQTILRNLTANAIQHGAPPVTVTLGREGAAVAIDVHDGGPGVPTELRDRVFDRFVRGDESRHGSSSGLGLAIAAENARLLGGTLALAADGSTFRLTLPLPGEATA